MFNSLSVKWKVLIIAIAGPLITTILMGWHDVKDIERESFLAIEEKSKAIVLMAEAARKDQAHKLDIGLVKPLNEIPKDLVVQAVPVISAINVAKENAAEAGYTMRVPKVNPRNPKNEPTALEREVLSELKRTNAEEKLIVEDDVIRYFRPIRLTKDCMFCHGDPRGERDVTGGIKEGWKVGEIHGAFVIISSLDTTKKHIEQAKYEVAGIGVIIIALIVGIAWFLLKVGIIKPLYSIRNFATAVAGGNLEAKPEGQFSAELDEMKGSIETMVDNLKGKMREAEAQSEEATKAKGRAEDAMQEAKASEERTAELLSKMQRVASDALEIAQQVSTASEELSAQVEQVNRGAEIQNQRTAETATAMEEMNATVLEVARNSGSSAESADNARGKAEQGEGIVSEAVTAIQSVNKQAQELTEEMTRLGEQADGISRIMDVISDIADQTNLLALNAAIEAARAGDAGRGFAVVADEVRKLAEKTMDATKEVGSSIEAIQQGARRNIHSVEQAATATVTATDLANKSGEALSEIVQLAHETSDQVRSIATAAEQQSAASDEINRAVEDISRITSETSQGMVEAAHAIEDLARLASELNRLIDEMNS